VPLKHTGINSAEHCAPIDSRCKTTVTHLESLIDGRGAPPSCFAVAMPLQRVVARLVWMFAAMRRQTECLFALGDKLSTLEVNRLSTGVLRASRLERVVVADDAHAARLVAHSLEHATYGGYAQAHCCCISLAHCVHRNHTRHQKQYEKSSMAG
jgi:hypothetical protein